MNVSTIEIPKEEALTKLAQYRGLNRKQIQPEDERLERLYKMVSKGARVVDVNEAFRATGVNELGQPKLAIARADWDECWAVNYGTNGRVVFKPEAWSKKTSQHIGTPNNTFTGLTNRDCKTAVPHIPPGIRPNIALSNFHILFEVEKWETYPVDPFLLRHISGSLYVVVAEWELTELEASLLGSMRAGN